MKILRLLFALSPAWIKLQYFEHRLRKAEARLRENQKLLAYLKSCGYGKDL